MSLLNYQVHYNPTSHKDVLSKFRAFALAQGWTIDKYETSKDWLWDGAKYDWLAGNTDFLQIYSNGYGSQDLIFRFHFEGTGVDGQSEGSYITGINPNERTPDDQISTKPYLQDEYMGSRNVNTNTLPPGAHVALWLFGNDKHLIAVDQVSASIVIMWFVGTFELFNPGMATVAFCRATFIYTSGATVWKWYQAESYPNQYVSPWDTYSSSASYSYYHQYWWDGAWQNGERIKPNISFNGSDAVQLHVFNSLSRAVRANTFTGKRVLIKPTYFGKRVSDDVWMPIGTLPFYRIESSGLQIGESVTYGSEEYLVFPNTFPSRKYGQAFRIV